MNEIDKEISSILVALAKLEEISKSTIGNVNRLADSVDKLTQVSEQMKSLKEDIEEIKDEQKSGISPHTLKGLLAGLVTILIAWGSWVTLFFFSLEKEVAVNKTVFQNDLASYQYKIENDLKNYQNKIETDMIIYKEKTDLGISNNANQISYLKGIARPK